MRRRKNGWIFLFALVNLLAGASVFSQKVNIDSLRNVLEESPADTNKINLMIRIATEYQGKNPDSALSFANQAIDLSGTLTVGTVKGWNVGIGRGEHTLGIAYFRKSDYSRSLEHYLRSLAIWEGIERKGNKDRGKVSPYVLGLKSKTLGNIGLVYWNQSNFSKALRYYFSALHIDESLGNSSGVARQYGNVGIIYAMQAAATPDSEMKQALLRNALRYFFKSYSYFEEIDNKVACATILGNIGGVFESKDQLKQAMSYYIKALALREELQRPDLIASACGNIGSVFYKLRDYPSSQKFLSRAILISDSITDMEGSKEWNLTYSRLDSAMGNYKGSLMHFKRFIALRDTMINEENSKKQAQLEMQYEFDKKETVLKAEAEKKAAVEAAENRKQQIILYSVFFGFCVVLLLIVFVVRALRITNRQKRLIERQKSFVEEKKKEILDSIHYAKRIQTALLPTDKYIDKSLKRLIKF